MIRARNGATTCLLAWMVGVAAAAGPPEWSGDLRIRVESDFDSRNAAAAPRDDRLRVRLRGRLGARFALADRWRLEGRVRSAAAASQQSPHVTVMDFDGNALGDHGLFADRWLVERRTDALTLRLGRADLPFWQQNEIVFDGDVTAPGLAGEWRGRRLTVSAAFVTAPAGMQDYVGRLAGVQGVRRAGSDEAEWVVAGGVYAFRGDPDDPEAGRWLDGNGSRDYTLVQASVQRRRVFRRGTLEIGLDVFRNLEDYAAAGADAFAAAHRDEVDGAVAGVAWTAPSWRWCLRAARVETLAVNASLAQDDWVRWGTATQTRSSGFQGVELEVRRSLTAAAALRGRLFLVEAPATPEDGNRVRLDLDIRL